MLLLCLVLSPGCPSSASFTPRRAILASLWVTRNSRNVVSLAYDRARQCVEEFTCGICPPPIDLPTAACHVASVSLSRQVRNFLLGSMGRGEALAFLVALRTAEAGGEVVSHSPIDHDLYPSLCRNNWGRNLHHLSTSKWIIAFIGHFCSGFVQHSHSLGCSIKYILRCVVNSFLLLLYFDGRWLSRLSCSDRRRLESGRRVTG